MNRLLDLVAVGAIVATIVAVSGCGSADPCDDIAEEDCGGCCDAMEPNGHPCHATQLGNFTDSPDTSQSFDELTYTVGDEDWYEFHVTDAADFGGNPWITVSLSGAGASNLELAGWFRCDDGDESSTCTVGIEDGTEGDGCRAVDVTAGFRLDPECSFTDDDDGWMLVRVTSPGAGPSCDAYQLDVTVR